MSGIELNQRRARLGLSLAELSRLAQVEYRRLWTACGGSRLKPDELHRIELALRRAEGGRAAAD